MSSLNSLSLQLPTSPLTSGSHRCRSSFTSSLSTSQPLSFPFLTIQSKRSTPRLISRTVTDDDEWRKETSSRAGSDVVAAEPEEPEVVTEVGELKYKLKELLYGTDRGLNVSSKTRAEIIELITRLEAKNPTPAPTEALQLLNGKWILAS